MKIAINGEIINTKNIFTITNIESDISGPIYHQFTIRFFNKKERTLQIYSNCYISKRTDGEYFTSIEGKGAEPKSVTSTRKLEDLINSPEYQESLKKLQAFRQSIIEIWAKNQSTIPQINLDI